MKSNWIFILLLIVVYPAFCSDSPLESEILSWDEAKLPAVSKSLIRIGLQATDRDGNPVKGLSAANFKLYQDGREQKITEFREVVRTNDGSDPRIIVFVIDDLGLSRKKFNQVRTAIKNFADTFMQPADMVGIARTAGGGVVSQPLTSDAARIRASLDRMQWSIEVARPAQNVLLATSSSSTTFIQSCSSGG